MSVGYEWERLYKEAVLEVRDGKLAEKIAAAQAAVDLRLNELSLNGNGKEAQEEKSALADAIHGLKILRAER